MGNNGKLLLIFSFLLLLIGLGVFSLSLSPTKEPAKATPLIQVTASSSATPSLEGEKAVVTKVVDGDTIQVNGNTTIRFIGIDTPETVDPRRPVGCFGKEASNKTKSLLTGKNVVLQKDISETDKFGRDLRYIYLQLDDGSFLFVNDYLVREGFAHAVSYPPDIKFQDIFRQAEKEARDAKKGLWDAC